MTKLTEVSNTKRGGGEIYLLIVLITEKYWIGHTTPLFNDI